MGTLIAVFGGISFVQVRATRSLAERVRASSQVEELGRSAIEEACAALEDTLEPPPVGEARTRDLSRDLAWPAVVEPLAARHDALAAGATVSSVAVRSSAWKFERRVIAPELEVAREFGVLELSVRVKCGGADRTLVARRYASTARRAGEARLRVRIAVEDVYRGSEAP